MTFKLFLGVLALGGGLAGSVPAAVITNSFELSFEDLGPSVTGTHMPTNYGGLRWASSDWHFMTLSAVPTNNFLALSGTATAFFRLGGQDFYFDHARCWSRRGLDANGRFYFILHHDGVMVYDGRVGNDGRFVFDATHQVFSPGYTGLVDSVAVVFDQGGDDWDHFAMDDVAYRTVQAVPDAPVFVEIDPGLPSATRNAAAWGDYNNDGLKDVFVAASGSKGATITRVYRNQGGTFVDAALPGFTLIDEGVAAWADADNDGDLDLAVIGKTDANTTATRVYRNNQTNFVPMAGGFVNVYGGDLGWADYDGDGDQDLLVIGITSPVVGSPYFTKLYRNDRTNFVAVAHPFPNVYLGSVSWGDYDGDGDPDLFLSGAGSPDGDAGEIFRNDGGTFTNLAAGISGLSLGDSDWGDVDNDGDLDLLVTGQGDQGFMSAIYRNDGGLFTNIEAGLTGLVWSACAWGDCDNDGDLDVALAGYDVGIDTTTTKVYRNSGGVFQDVGGAFHGMMLGALDWVDVDSDRRTELCVAGDGANGNGTQFQFYRNITSFTNTPPGAPTNLVAQSDGETVVLSWTAAQDAQTPEAGLLYEVRVGTTSGGFDVVSAPAVATSAVRQVVRVSGITAGLSVTLHGLHVGSNYYWSVQAVDAARSGGPFAPEAQFLAENAVPEAVAVAMESGDPQVAFGGSPHGNYVVEGSSDFVTWAVVSNATADAAGRIFVQPDAGQDHLFYRARRP